MNTSYSSAASGDLVGYTAMIHEATGAPRRLLSVLENIMRQAMFHSALDWQTRAEFDRGAKRALYRRDTTSDDAQVSLRATTFQVMQAESEAAQDRTSGSAAQIAATTSRLDCARDAQAAAQVGLDPVCNR
jgi:hypothetical protein